MVRPSNKDISLKITETVSLIIILPALSDNPEKYTSVYIPVNKEEDRFNVKVSLVEFVVTVLTETPENDDGVAFNTGSDIAHINVFEFGAQRSTTDGGVRSPTSKNTLKLSNEPKSLPPF